MVGNEVDIDSLLTKFHQWRSNPANTPRTATPFLAVLTYRQLTTTDICTVVTISVATLLAMRVLGQCVLLLIRVALVRPHSHLMPIVPLLYRMKWVRIRIKASDTTFRT